MRSTYCIYPVSSTQQISRSPINTSRTKQLYSFSKDSRFKQAIPNCDRMYELPSYFRQNPSRMKMSRQARSSSRKLSPLREEGSRFDSRYLNVGPTFSMRPQTKKLDKTMSIEAQNDNPGAGTYENPQALSPRGTYVTSKYKSTSITKFNPRRSQRFFQLPNMNPGPGCYEQVNTLSDAGKYPLSKSMGGGKRFFDQERRVVKFQHIARKNENPGPGSYRSSSDFGHYDGNVYNWTGGISYLGNSKVSRRTSRTRF